jgi:glycosyltransferase involved in cell wall biosynthesis
MKDIIISPSGKMYGSEQVLVDYLKYTGRTFSIYVCARGLLYNKLKKGLSQHTIHHFRKTKFLYFKLLLLCFAGKVGCIYVNEAGHSKYISLLARLFSSVKFIIHVRLIEDTASDRWPAAAKPSNLVVVSISRCIQELLPVPNVQIYDPYDFHLNEIRHRPKREDKLNIGVIGRISVTKGIDTLIKLLEIVKDTPYNRTFHFHFFGDPMPDVVDSGRYDQLCKFSNVIIYGFRDDVEEIFNSVDCVIHSSANEPLGRIFLEAVDFGKPFIGVASGGIGEIGSLLQLTTLLVDKADGDVSESLFRKLKFLHDNYSGSLEEIGSRKSRAAEVFSPNKYAQAIDSLISQ